ncbi:hypothetical protein AYI69_g4850 [Smittium culicis]|uniref:Uncharacterized protein n=1 Tax=Smittium culicis TaxID=133412 RepID=A0A1R1YAC9_9FUNG|nr:hypothetical protein AYI69_g4850 [Smittium culicis]
MISISVYIRPHEYTIRSSRRRYVCFPLEQEDEPVLQLVLRPKGIGPECTGLKMVRVQKPLLLLILESDIPGGSESSLRMNHNDSGYTDVEASHLVSRSEGTVNISANHTPSNNCNARFQMRKISAVGKKST